MNRETKDARGGGRSVTEGRRGPARSRRWIVLTLALVLGAVLYVTPTGYMIILPGVTKATGDLVTVQGGRKPSAGRFLLVTVSTYPANAYIYLFAKLWPTAELEQLPQDPTAMEQEGARQMSTSQALAAVVAEKAHGLPAKVSGTGARVTAVIKGGPAEGVFQVGDVITAVSGHPVQFQDELRDQLGRLPVGRPARLTLRRDGQTLEVTATPVSHPTRPGRAALMIDIDDDSISYEVPVPVQIDAGNIVGPSAGLMFSLEVYNQLLEGEDLTRGRIIAGTGSILPDGRVGPIGGIDQKVISAERAGASLFFAPLEDAAQAKRTAKKIRVVPVGHLQDAIDYLRQVAPSAQQDSVWFDFVA